MHTVSPLALILVLWLVATRPVPAVFAWLQPGTLAHLLATRLQGRRDLTVALLVAVLAGLLFLKAAYGLHAVAGFLAEVCLLLLAFGNPPEAVQWPTLIRRLKDADVLGTGLLANVGGEGLNRPLYRGLLAPLIWYLLLGPAAAVAYRVAADVPAGAKAAVHWPDAVPARLTVLLVAIAGNFQEAWDTWRQRDRQLPDPAALDAVVAAAAGIRRTSTSPAGGGIASPEEQAILVGLWGRGAAFLAGGVLLLWLAAGVPLVGA